MTDWRAWHAAYDDPDSPLAQRLALVQLHIDRWLDASSPRPVHVTSICAGQGRDLIDVLSQRPDAGRVTATLVESDSGLVAAARAAVAEAALASVEVRCADAGAGATYRDVPRADLLIACGVLGNISDADVRNVVVSASQLCAAGASVIWTRTRRAPDLTAQVRAWFEEAGYVEEAFEAPRDQLFSVGVHRLVAPPAPKQEGLHLFRFLR